MAYSWTNTVTAGELITDGITYEIADVVGYILTNHCSSDYDSNNATKDATVCGSHDSSYEFGYSYGATSGDSTVNSTNNSSACVNSYNSTVYSTYGCSVHNISIDPS